MPHSLEKFLVGRSGALAAAWDSVSAKSPWNSLMKEWAGVTVAVRNILQPQLALERELLEKKLAFLRWDLETKVDPVSLENQIRAFFGDLGFRPARTADSDSSLLDSVLSRREGASAALSVLFAWATECVNSQANSLNNDSGKPIDDVVENGKVGRPRLIAEMVQNAPPFVLRVRSFTGTNTEMTDYVSADGGGKSVDQSGWLNWCHTESSLEKLSFSDVWYRLLSELQASLDSSHTSKWTAPLGTQAQIFVVTQMIAARPSSVRLFAERAVLRHRLGDDSGALEDLKRFFAFQDRSSAAPALVELFDSLRR